MSATTLAITVWVVIAVGWIGFLIIAGALVRDAIGALSNARRKEPARQRPHPAQDDTP